MLRHMRQSDLLCDSTLKQLITDLNLTVFWQNAYQAAYGLTCSLKSCGKSLRTPQSSSVPALLQHRSTTAGLQNMCQGQDDVSSGIKSKTLQPASIPHLISSKKYVTEQPKRVYRGWVFLYL